MTACAREEVCDWHDNDRDGIIDEGFDADQDGHWACGLSEVYFDAGDFDCDDADSGAHPGAEELCDGLDNDCVSGVDDGCGSWAVSFEDRVTELVVADLDLDGSSDLLAPGSSDEVGFVIDVLRGNGEGAFERLGTVVSEAPVLALTARPDQGDRRVFAVGPGKLFVYQPTDAGLVLLSAMPLWTEALLDEARADVGDLDGDGDLDVAVLATRSEGPLFLQTLSQITDGGFEPSQVVTLDAEMRPAHVAVVDLDRDGDLDIVGVGDAQLRWFLNDGRGVITAESGLALDAPPTQVAVADADADGYPDVLMAIPDRWKLLAAWNVASSGPEVFRSLTSIDAGVRHPNTLTVIDLDDEGSSDLVVGDVYESSLQALVRTESGFEPTCVIPTFPTPLAVYPIVTDPGGATGIGVVYADPSAMSLAVDPCSEGVP